MTEFNIDSPTFRLYPVPSFIDGMAMALDYSGTMPEFTHDKNPSEADAKAIASDWAAVANDFTNAIRRIIAR